MKTLLFATAFSAVSVFSVQAQDWWISDFEGDPDQEIAEWIAADGGTFEVVDDPFDATNKVLKFTRKDGGAIWDGIISNYDRENPANSIGLDKMVQVGISEPDKYQYVVFRALQDESGELVAKVEYKAGAEQYGSEHLPLVSPSRPGKWQTFIFDLGNKNYSRSKFDLAANNDKNGGYNVFLIQPNRKSGGKPNVTYIDDIYFTNNPPVIPIHEQSISGFASMATPYGLKLSWQKMDVADHYIVYMNDMEVAVIDDNRTTELEVSYDELGIEEGMEYVFGIEGVGRSGEKTDGLSYAKVSKMKVAEDFSWAMMDDFEKARNWSRWQDGAHDSFCENPVKDGRNSSGHVMKMVRTVGDSLAYGMPGRTSKSNSFVTFTQKNYVEVAFNDSPDEADAFKYIQLQMYRPHHHGAPVLKVLGKPYDPVLTSMPQAVRDSLVWDNGTKKQYYYKNTCNTHEWTTFIYQIITDGTYKSISQIEISPDNAFDNILSVDQQRTFYLDNIVATVSPEPIFATGLNSTKADDHVLIFESEGKLYIDVKKPSAVTVELFDLAARKVSSQSLPQTVGLSIVDMPVLNPGCYVVLVKGANFSKCVKISVR